MNKNESTTGLSVRQQLDAICWAANEAGMSYGQFCLHLTDEERDRVFERYEKMVKAREAEKLRREMLQKKRRSSVKRKSV